MAKMAEDQARIRGEDEREAFDRAYREHLNKRAGAGVNKAETVVEEHPCESNPNASGQQRPASSDIVRERGSAPRSEDGDRRGDRGESTNRRRHRDHHHHHR